MNVKSYIIGCIFRCFFFIRIFSFLFCLHILLHLLADVLIGSDVTLIFLIDIILPCTKYICEILKGGSSDWSNFKGAEEGI